MWFSDNEEQTELDKIKGGGGVLFLGAQLSNKTLSFSSENHEKTPGIETNPPLQNYPYNFNFHMDHANEKGVSSS